MRKVHNFSSGPSILPPEVLKETAEAIIDYKSSGLSILEMSHRSSYIQELLHEGTELIIELLNLPGNYKPIFLTGGASSQFYMVPMNLLSSDQSAAYIDTGRWADKAFAEAKIYGHPEKVASSMDEGYTYIPEEITLRKDYSYLHITSNNTVAGTQFHHIPHVNCPIVADMSSDIFSRPIDIHQYGLIYAGAQKNLGPAGTTLVIVNEDILGKTDRQIPSMLDYRNHIQNMSSFNTPPVYAIYVSVLYLRWLKQQGGVQVMHKRSIQKSQLLYEEIDRNPLFVGTVKTVDRSLMNVTFKARSKDIEQAFIKLCNNHGVVGIEGHRSVGGFRASLYNAMPIDSVRHLVMLMQMLGQE